MVRIKIKETGEVVDVSSTRAEDLIRRGKAIRVKNMKVMQSGKSRKYKQKGV